MNNFIFCKFLNDIPPRFRLNSAEKNNFGSDFDKNDKKFIVSFVSVFNVNCRIVCDTFGISVTSLNRWKAEFSSKIDPLDLLRDPSPVSTAEAVAVQWEPTVSRIPLNRYCLSRGNGRQEWELMLFSTLMQILSLIIRFLFPWLVKRGKHSFRTKNEVQIDHKKLSDLLKLKAQPNQQQNNERIPSTNVNLEEKNTSTEKRTVKKRKFNETVETGEEIGEEIEKKCKLFCCISAECAATFIRSSSLKNHLETKSHYYGKSGATHTNKKKEGWSPPTERISVHCIEDKMIGVVKDAGNHLDNRNHTNRRSDNAEINVGNDINNNGK
jgi:hypothetical protein